MLAITKLQQEEAAKGNVETGKGQVFGTPTLQRRQLGNIAQMTPGVKKEEAKKETVDPRQALMDKLTAKKGFGAKKQDETATTKKPMSYMS